MTKIAGSGSISQRHGSPDPDPTQNVMDILLLFCSDWKLKSSVADPRHFGVDQDLDPRARASD